jgi:hypothetical protein
VGPIALLALGIIASILTVVLHLTSWWLVMPIVATPAGGIWLLIALEAPAQISSYSHDGPSKASAADYYGKKYVGVAPMTGFVGVGLSVSAALCVFPPLWSLFTLMLITPFALDFLTHLWNRSWARLTTILLLVGLGFAAESNVTYSRLPWVTLVVIGLTGLASGFIVEVTGAETYPTFAERDPKTSGQQSSQRDDAIGIRVLTVLVSATTVAIGAWTFFNLPNPFSPLGLGLGVAGFSVLVVSGIPMLADFVYFCRHKEDRVAATLAWRHLLRKQRRRAGAFITALAVFAFAVGYWAVFWAVTWTVRWVAAGVAALVASGGVWLWIQVRAASRNALDQDLAPTGVFNTQPLNAASQQLSEALDSVRSLSVDMEGALRAIADMTVEVNRLKAEAHDLESLSKISKEEAAALLRDLRRRDRTNNLMNFGFFLFGILVSAIVQNWGTLKGVFYSLLAELPQ